MQKRIFLIIGLLSIVLASGCTSDVKPYMVDASETSSASLIQFWNDAVQSENSAPKSKAIAEIIMEGKDIPLYYSFSQVCLIQEKELSSGTKYYEYYLKDCDLSKLNSLKTSDDFDTKTAYIELSNDKAGLIFNQKTLSTFQGLYNEESVTEDDSMDTLIRNIVNKATDSVMSLFLISSRYGGYIVLSPAYEECSITMNEDSACLDSLFQKMETATPTIIQRISFDNNFISSCRTHLQEWDTQNSLDMIKDVVREIFEKGGYNGNVDDYITYDTVCQRAKAVYSRIYEGSLDDISEPTQRFFIATSFYRLSSMGESEDSFTNTVNQILA